MYLAHSLAHFYVRRLATRSEPDRVREKERENSLHIFFAPKTIFFKIQHVRERDRSMFAKEKSECGVVFLYVNGCVFGIFHPQKCVHVCDMQMKKVMAH